MHRSTSILYGPLAVRHIVPSVGPGPPAPSPDHSNQVDKGQTAVDATFLRVVVQLDFTVLARVQRALMQPREVKGTSSACTLNPDLYLTTGGDAELPRRPRNVPEGRRSPTRMGIPRNRLGRGLHFTLRGRNPRTFPFTDIHHVATRGYFPGFSSA